MELSRVYMYLYSSGVNETGYSPKHQMTYMDTRNIPWSD